MLVMDTFAPTEKAMASQMQSLASSMQQENRQSTSISTLTFCIPYIERFLPGITRDFRDLLRIHANGIRQLVDNEDQLDPKSRAFHLSAELYLFQHSCHWFCKSKTVADARLAIRHKVSHNQVLDSVSVKTRANYQQWLKQAGKP